MENAEFISIPQVARILNMSRIAVYKKVKNGTIESIKIGKNYAVSKEYVLKNIDNLMKKNKRPMSREKIVEAANKAFDQYQETFKRLGNE